MKKQYMQQNNLLYKSILVLVWSIVSTPHSTLYHCYCAFTAQAETYKIACHFSNCRMLMYFVVYVEKTHV